MFLGNKQNMLIQCCILSLAQYPLIAHRRLMNVMVALWLKRLATTDLDQQRRRMQLQYLNDRALFH